MKILLVAMNSQYIHSHPGVYSMKAYAKAHVTDEGLTIEIAEYTINQSRDFILRDIYERHPQVVCFSCYIWNWEYVKDISGDLSLVASGTDIWLGGPEVSWDPESVLICLPFVKGIMRGEGEETFRELCAAYQAGKVGSVMADMKGISYREETGECIHRPERPCISMDDLPLAREDLHSYRNRIIYYESSRGCPFSCSYCLSAIDREMRYRSLDQVKKDLGFFLDNGVSQVKFVDRTFNVREDRALAIWTFLIDHDNGVTNFHFEMAGDRMGEESFALLEKARPGLIQMEIGVQTTNSETLREIRRITDLEKLKENVKRIKAFCNIHLHLDLIAGLPFEDLESFSRSFDEVYHLAPDQLQLGFLKVLRGSPLHSMVEKYGIRKRQSPPYEILSNQWMSFQEICDLKGVAHMVEIYYNSRQFLHGIQYLSQYFDSPFTLYRTLSDYAKERGMAEAQWKRSRWYELLLDFTEICPGSAREHMREWLIYDYYLRENAKTRPEFAGGESLSREAIKEFYDRETEEFRYLRGYGRYDRNQVRRMTHLEDFPTLGKRLLFDYSQRDPLTHNAAVHEVIRSF